MTPKKDIVRFYKTGKKKIVHYCVTLDEAREWCNSPLTSTARYFDGFVDHGEHGEHRTAIYQHYFAPTAEYH